MPFETDAGRQNGYYGKYTFDYKAKQWIFHPLGKEILLDNATRDIETNDLAWTVSFMSYGEKIVVDVPLNTTTEYKTFAKAVTGPGADVTPANARVVLDTLRQQQEVLEQNGTLKRIYDHLGWIKLRDVDSNGNPVWRYCYRGHTLIGSNTIKASYSDPYMVRSAGSFSVWRQGVIDEVIGHTPLEIVLLAGLSAVVNGLIAPRTTGESPIIHINGLSGTGKTTGCELAVSASSAPFQGASKEKLSLLRSWGATGNAVIKRCEGNRGAVLAFNEIAKFREPDMTLLVYNLSEGTDKERLTTELKDRCSEA